MLHSFTYDSKLLRESAKLKQGVESAAISNKVQKNGLSLILAE